MRITLKAKIKGLEDQVEAITRDRDEYKEKYLNVKKRIWGEVDHTRRSYIDTIVEVGILVYFSRTKPGKAQLEEQIKWLRDLVEKMTIKVGPMTDQYALKYEPKVTIEREDHES